MRHSRHSLWIPVLILALVLPAASRAQTTGPFVVQPVFAGESPPLSELVALLPPIPTAQSLTPPIPYEIPDLEPFPPGSLKAGTLGEDPVRQSFVRKTQPTGTLLPPEISFEGNINRDNFFLLGIAPVPPDTEGDVGKDYFIQMNNIVSEIFDKETGASVAGPFPNNLFFLGTGAWCELTNDGDPIVLYDHKVKRWIFSQLAIRDPDGAAHQCFAVSKTRDPLGSYYLYDYVVATTQTGGEVINDYPKISVWRDGLYYSHNDFDLGPTFNILSAVAIAFDKAAMYAGDPAAVGVKFQLFPTAEVFPFYLLASHWEGNKKPERGAPNIYWQALDEEVFGDGSGVDGYRRWAFSADFDDPLASTFIELPRVPAPPYDLVLPCGRNCFDQPFPGTVAEGQGLDDIGLRLMYRAHWRSFGQYDSVLLNHTVNADGVGTGGIRWVELRDYGDGFELYQTGTYAPADGDNRFMGSIAQDRKGNIALGFSVTGLTTFPSVRYTGRTPDDPLGEMQTEVECHAGTGVQLFSFNRWGDYSTMSVDPQDGCTFWYTQEYYETSIPRDWRTRVCRFRFDNCQGDDDEDSDSDSDSDEDSDSED